MLKVSALLTHNTLNINVGILKASSAHWNADTSVPVALWSKGEDGEYLSKAGYHWGLCREKAQDI